MQKEKQKEDRDWLHGARVPRAGPEAELWTRSRTAPGRGCAEVRLWVLCEAQDGGHGCRKLQWGGGLQLTEKRWMTESG